jgi:hypothetical protein
MPHLLNFIENNGVLLSNHHTPLIAHTATDILTSLTGVYGDRMGVPVSNSYRYFKPDGSTSSTASFAYWTDQIGDGTYNMLTADGTNAPAPWVPYTRAGCNVGAVGMANISLENVGSDIPTVFGANSPQQQEAQANPSQAAADFEGIAVHCAQSSSLCSSGNGGVSDVLPAEPGGYTGYQALFGNTYVAPQISPTGPMTDLDGQVIQDSSGHVGFPGFDGMSAAVSLSYVAAMQEHGVPVTYAYISDAHDNHGAGPAGAFGPGEAGYEAQLKSYDNAFGAFFDRLAADGITKNNTLFVVTADENDHFVGGAPSPAGCDGVTVPCTYSQLGEINVNLAGLLATETGDTTPFNVHSDASPTIYLRGNPSPASGTARRFDQDLGSLTVTNPLTSATDRLTNYLADPVEEKLLHMVTADPARTPSVTLFAQPDYFLFAGAPNCTSPCVTEPSGSAWNHGDVAPDINTTWLGMVGPGVANLGVDSTTWSDHTDIRPTMMALLGLKDDYSHDGRVLFEDLNGWAIPPALLMSRGAASQLAPLYKQLDAAVGEFGLDTLHISTVALESTSTNDSAYSSLESSLSTFGEQRDALVAQMNADLEGAEFNGQVVRASQVQSLIRQGNDLLSQVHSLAQSV